MEKENKKLDLCEKLAGCPEGTKLWSPLLGNCRILKIREDFITVGNEAIGLHSFDKHGHYFDSSEECLLFPSKENRDWDSWECPKPKVERFDPKTLQPFDKVLGRDSDYTGWRADFFVIINRGFEYPVRAVVNSWRQCIPYNEDTKYLLDTKDDAPEYYKWWEDKA